MYIYRTKAGVFSIVQKKGRWHIIYQDEDLGNYINPQQAADDLSGGHTFSPSNGIDPATLGIPEDIGEWEFIKS
jgi:hypothetical protein